MGKVRFHQLKEFVKNKKAGAKKTAQEDKTNAQQEKSYLLVGAFLELYYFNDSFAEGIRSKDLAVKTVENMLKIDLMSQNFDHGKLIKNNPLKFLYGYEAYILNHLYTEDG